MNLNDNCVYLSSKHESVYRNMMHQSEYIGMKHESEHERLKSNQNKNVLNDDKDVYGIGLGPEMDRINKPQNKWSNIMYTYVAACGVKDKVFEKHYCLPGVDSVIYRPSIKRNETIFSSTAENPISKNPYDRNNAKNTNSIIYVPMKNHIEDSPYNTCKWSLTSNTINISPYVEIQDVWSQSTIPL